MSDFFLTDEQAHAIKSAAQTVHESCKAAGWYTDLKTGEQMTRNVPEMLALIHSEVSEALEGYRKNMMDNHLPHRKSIEVELADAVIRILDTAEYLNLDLGAAIQEKFAYNQTRADHKLENRLKPGGKSI